MGSEKGNLIWGQMLKNYEKITFVNADGSLNEIVNNTYIEDQLQDYGYVRENRFQLLADGIEIYPDEYFHGVSLMEGTKHITENTYAIHWHTLTWVSKRTHFFRVIRTKILIPIFGNARGLKIMYSIRNKLGIGDNK